MGVESKIGRQPEDPMQRVLDNLWGAFASTGGMRTEDGTALLMVPEAQQIPRAQFFKREEEGVFQTTWRMCGNCRALVQIEHTPEYNLDELPPCPCCNSQSWEETEARQGKTDGHLGAPRVL